MGPDCRAARWGSEALFLSGLLVFLCVQMSLNLLPLRHRAVPVSPDDAYSYIVKAAEFESCFFQDCPALNDLRPQLALPEPDDTAAFERYRQYHRLFSFYSPINAVVLSGLHRAGMGWEKAFQAQQLAGIVLMGLAIAVWLRIFWGPGPTGFALFLLGFNVFAGHSLHRIVPSNLALVIALLTWSALIRKRAPSSWGLLVGIILMLAMHPIGRMYAVVAVFLYFFRAKHFLPERRWFFAGFGLLLIALAFVLPNIVARPELKVLHDPIPQNWSRLAGIREDIFGIAKKSTLWLGLDRENFCDAGMILSDLALLLIVGLVTVCSERRQRILPMGILLVPLLFADFLFPHPRYPAAIFERAWIPLAILLTGAIGQAAWYSLSLAIELAQRAIAGAEGEPPNGSSTPSWNGWKIVLLALVAMSLTRYGVYSTESKLERMRYRISTAISSGNIDLDPAQPERLLAESQAGDSVLYTHETLLYYFLTYGCFDRGAVYYSAVKGTAAEKRWLTENESIRYLAAINPRHLLLPATWQGLDLSTTGGIELLTAREESFRSLFLHLENPGGGAVLIVETASDDQRQVRDFSVEIPLVSGSQSWLRLPEPTAGCSSITLSAKPGPVYLRGIRVGSDAVLNWPWDQGISLAALSARSESSRVEISFSTKALCPGLDRPVKVLSDSGSSVLAEVLPR